MKFFCNISAVCLLSLSALTLATGCKSSAANPAEPKANTGYVDFYAPGETNLYWDVRQWDEKAEEFKTVFSRLKPLDGPVLRLAAAPGNQQFRITFLNRVVLNPAVVEVAVRDRLVTPVRVELLEAGSTQVETRTARLGLTVRRFGPGVRITRSQANAHDVLATPQPPVPYQKKELARYPP